MQHQEGYGPLKLRSTLVPVANIGSKLGLPIVFLGLAMGLEQVAEKSTCDNGSAENLLGDAADGIVAGNSSVGFWWATVVTVETERITVILQDGTEAIVLLEMLENIPQVTPGQRLRLYLHENNIESEILIPYKIEIEEEKP